MKHGHLLALQGPPITDADDLVGICYIALNCLISHPANDLGSVLEYLRQQPAAASVATDTIVLFLRMALKLLAARKVPDDCVEHYLRPLCLLNQNQADIAPAARDSGVVQMAFDVQRPAVAALLLKGLLTAEQGGDRQLSVPDLLTLMGTAVPLAAAAGVGERKVPQSAETWADAAIGHLCSFQAADDVPATDLFSLYKLAISGLISRSASSELFRMLGTMAAAQQMNSQAVAELIVAAVEAFAAKHVPMIGDHQQPVTAACGCQHACGSCHQAAACCSTCCCCSSCI